MPLPLVRVGFALCVATAASACSTGPYNGPYYAWSVDGGCGEPPGYVGVGEQHLQDGACTAAAFCPLDGSSECLDAQAVVDASDASLP